MINFDYATGENRKKHSPNWPKIHDYPYIILIILNLDKDKQNYCFI